MVKAVEAESRLRKLGREIEAVCLFLAAGFLALFLVTYDPNDAWGRFTNVQNLGGVVGAYLSDFMYRGFGLSSFLFVFLLGLLAYWKWFKPETPILGNSNPWLIVRSLGFLLGLSSFSTLLVLWFWPKEFILDGQPVLPGGILGAVLASLLLETFKSFMAWALTLLLLLVAGMLFFNLLPRFLRPPRLAAPSRGKMPREMNDGEDMMPSGNEETEARSEMKLIGISLLPGEKIITDIQQGLLSKGFDITASNNIILTNRRLIIRLKRFMSSLQTYYVELDKITVMNIDTRQNWPRAAISWLFSIIVLLLSGLVFEKPLKQADLYNLFPLALVLLPFIIAIGELYLSKKVGINIAIPGFSEVNMGRPRGGGLFFQLRGGLGIHSSKLQEFIDQVYLQKQLLEGTRGEKYSKATPVPPTTSGANAQNRLSNLKHLYEIGDISAEEYENLRRKILSEI